MGYMKRFWPLYLLTAVAFLCVALWTDQAVTTIAENTPVPRRAILVIDPGHGGMDGGATSCTGVLESQINLQIGLKLNDLSHLLGYETRMIRTGDVSVYTQGNTIASQKASDLRNRVRIVNETENGILISIHQNTFSDSKYRGAQVFYAATQGSRELADTMQALFLSTLNPGSNRQEKAASNIYLLQHIRRTGILVECGFLSNAEEEAKLRSDAYQNQICCVILYAISDYLPT